MLVRESMYNGAFVYVNVPMCRVVNLCQLCAAVPLTSDRRLEPTWAADGAAGGEGGPGGLEELGPLSVITLIKPALCDD